MKIQPTVGNFLAQGIAGGALGGFTYVFLITLREGSSDMWMVLSSTPFCMIIGSIIGVIEAACVWVLYSSAGIRLRAATRVSIASVVATLIVVVAGFQFEGIERALITLLMSFLSFAVPPALMVDSNVRPWKLFTAGYIAERDDGIDHLFESKSAWAIAGTLPLRFLSLTIAGLWLLYIANQPKGNEPNLWLALVYGLPLLYTGISAFLTFRSPGKLLVLFLGIGGNIPVILGGLVCYAVSNTYSGATDIAMLFKICCAFLVSWTIFLLARLSVETDQLTPLSILPEKVLPRGSEEVA